MPDYLINKEKTDGIYNEVHTTTCENLPILFIFAGSETDAYKQIGNAIPPVMFWYIAKSIND